MSEQKNTLLRSKGLRLDEISFWADRKVTKVIWYLYYRMLIAAVKSIGFFGHRGKENRRDDARAFPTYLHRSKLFRMIKRYWRKPRRRYRNTDRSSGSFSCDSASFEFSYEFTAGSYKHINLPKGCLKSRCDRQQDQHADKLVISNQIISARKVVTFQHVCIREYERIVGDNPSCSRGAPVRYVGTNGHHSSYIT